MAKDNPDVLHLSVDAQEIKQLPCFDGVPQPAVSHFLRFSPSLEVTLTYSRRYGVTPLGAYQEGSGKGITYYIPCECGKINSNHVISVLTLQIAANPGHLKLILTFDNCAVNKNYFVLAFCYELVHFNTFLEVEIHFMVAGHTKFAPDRMFAYNVNMLKGRPMYEVSDLVKTVNSGRATSYRAEEIRIGDERLSDYKAGYEKLFPSLTGIQGYHSLLFTKTADDLTQLQVKEWTESAWIAKPRFQPKVALQQTPKTPLPRKELSPKKMADLVKQSAFVKDGLSYARI